VAGAPARPSSAGAETADSSSGDGLTYPERARLKDQSRIRTNLGTFAA
jgi:hypothetical protein